MRRSSDPVVAHGFRGLERLIVDTSKTLAPSIAVDVTINKTLVPLMEYVLAERDLGGGPTGGTVAVVTSVGKIFATSLP